MGAAVAFVIVQMLRASKQQQRVTHFRVLCTAVYSTPSVATTITITASIPVTLAAQAFMSMLIKAVYL